jgi:hypothetical protein
VWVYRSVLEFYKGAFEVLTKARGKLVLAIIREHSHLEGIVAEFLTRADQLNNVVHSATMKITQDIESMLIESKGEFLVYSPCYVYSLDFSLRLARWPKKSRTKRIPQFFAESYSGWSL